MIVISSELVNEINKMKEIEEYISIVVDYKKEEEYIDIREKVLKDIQNLNSEFTGNDIGDILKIIDKEADEYYLYESDEVVEAIFPQDENNNNYIHSAFQWINSDNKIAWLINCVLTEKEHYNAIDNVNDNYIISSILL